MSLLITCCVLLSSIQAQQKKITGYVKAEGDSVPVPFANIHVKGLQKNTVADIKGFFSLLADENAVLEVSGNGYFQKELTISGENTYEVYLRARLKDLDTVTITTALGIKRHERSLGYATATVSGEQLTNAMSNNWMDALSGKVAGLNLIKSNGGPAGSVKIILRGENNLTDGTSNEALVVVDGVVVNQGSGRRTGTNAGESVYGVSGDNMPADYGSNMNDINPEDIESVTVLKGPAAAALYGQRGANGAIMITTKSGGGKNRKMNVTFRSNAAIDQVNRWPDLQYEYGQGTGGGNYYSWGASADGASTRSTSSAWGPKFDGQMFYQYNPTLQGQDTVRTLWKPYVNQVRDYFTTGQTYTNSLSLEGGTDKSTTRLSVTTLQNKWIIPNTGYNRNGLSYSYTSKLSDKLQIATTLGYTYKNSDNLPGGGYGNQSIMYWYIFWEPSADLNWLKNYWTNGKTNIDQTYPFSSYPRSPYAIAYEYLNKLKRHSITGNAKATYSFTKNLSLQVRTSLDMSYEQRAQQRPYDASTSQPKGSYKEQDIFSMEQNSDFLLSYNKKFSNDFNFNASFGGSALVNRYKRDENSADSLSYPGIYKFSNALGIVRSNVVKSNYNLNSFYGLVNTSYKSLIYLDLTARRDWNSVLATPSRTDNVGFNYGSASTSFIVSDVVKMPRFINYTKLRFSASSVGSGLTTPYLTSFNYVTAGSLFGGGLTNPSLLANANLLPLRTVNYEVGTNIAMFGDRINLDVALYTGNTKNQIISRIVDAGSGYTSAKTNLSQINNKGIEIGMNAIPIRIKGFKWTTMINFSANKNTVSGLKDSSIVLATGPTGGIQVIAKNGGSVNDLYGYGFQRTSDGRVIYDGTTGVAKLTDATSQLVRLGRATPSGKISWGNDFTYKRFVLHVLFDGQYGGVAYSLTAKTLAEQGKTTNTLPGRYNGIIGNGVVQNDDGSYRTNDVIATDVTAFYTSVYGGNNGEGQTFSTNFIKFREASLYYSLSPGSLKKVGIKNLTVGIYGRDLFTWSKWPAFDPELGTLSGTDIIKGIEVAQFPSTRSLGASLTVAF
ncbi:SusC/RagA family TonB-linked outer membrane protein [Polluticoccus soli]